MENTDMLFQIVVGENIPLAEHPLFAKRWDEAANAYNAFVEKLNLDDAQSNELRGLIALKCAVERLGYYTAFKFGAETSKLDVDRAHMLFEFLGMSKENRAKVLDFMAELSGRGE